MIFFSTVFYASDSLQPLRILKTQNPNLWPLSLCFVLGPAISPFSLYSSNLSLTSHPHSLIHSCFARSSPISAYFQVIYTISHWIWNFLLFFIKKYTDQMVELELCFTKLGFVFFFFYFLFFEIFDQNRIELIFFFSLSNLGFDSIN